MPSVLFRVSSVAKLFCLAFAEVMVAFNRAISLRRDWWADRGLGTPRQIEFKNEECRIANS